MSNLNLCLVEGALYGVDYSSPILSLENEREKSPFQAMIPSKTASILSVCLPDGSVETLYCTVRIPCIVLTYLLNLWGRVLLEKPTGSQLVKKLNAFY